MKKSYSFFLGVAEAFKRTRKIELPVKTKEKPNPPVVLTYNEKGLVVPKPIRPELPQDLKYRYTPTEFSGGM
jgi:hypothetical protein